MHSWKLKETNVHPTRYMPIPDIEDEEGTYARSKQITLKDDDYIQQSTFHINNMPASFQNNAFQLAIANYTQHGAGRVVKSKSSATPRRVKRPVHVRRVVLENGVSAELNQRLISSYIREIRAFGIKTEDNKWRMTVYISWGKVRSTNKNFSFTVNRPTYKAFEKKLYRVLEKANFVPFNAPRD